MIKELLITTALMMAVPFVMFVVCSAGYASVNPLDWGGEGRAAMALQLCIFLPWWAATVRKDVAYVHQRR